MPNAVRLIECHMCGKKDCVQFNEKQFFCFRYGKTYWKRKDGTFSSIEKVEEYDVKKQHQVEFNFGENQYSADTRDTRKSYEKIRDSYKREQIKNVKL